MSRPTFRALRLLVRGPEPGRGPVTLNRRDIFILPTRMGMLMCAVLLVMLLGGVNYENNLIYATTFILAGTTLVSILHTYRNLSGLVVSPSRPAPVFAGEPVDFVLQVHALNQRLRPSVEISGNGSSDQVDVHADEPARARLRLPSHHRGRLELGRVVVGTRYPFGLFKAWSVLRFQEDCLIFPAPEEGPVTLPPAGGLQDEEAYQAAQGAGVDEFQSVRDYQSGDSYRRVLWKALSRGQGLKTKEFAGSSSQDLWLDYLALNHLDIEARLSRLTRYVLEAHDRQLRYGLRLPDTLIPPDHGQDHKYRCLAALALFKA